MSIESDLRAEALVRDNYRCVWCACDPTYEQPSGQRLEMAHILPKGSGGKNVIENVIMLCRPCHDQHDGRAPRRLYDQRLLMKGYVAALYGYPL